MDSWSVLADLVLLLLAALVLGAIAERLRQSAIVGFLLAGMLLGPNALQWVSSESTHSSATGRATVSEHTHE